MGIVHLPDNPEIAKYSNLNNDSSEGKTALAVVTLSKLPM